MDYLQFHFRHPEAGRLLRVLATELRGRFTAQVREDLRGAHRALRARIRELLIGGAQDGSLFTSDPAFDTFMIASTVEGVLSQWTNSPGDAERFCDPESLVGSLLVPYETGTGPRERAQGSGEGPPKEAGADFLPPL